MKSVKLIKYATVVLFILIVLAVAGTIAVYNFYPKDSVGALLTSHAQDDLKRKVTIKGLDYSLKGIVLKGVTIYDGISEKDPVFASAENAIARFSILKLITQKRFDINHIRLQKLFLNIAYTNGTSNIEKLLRDLKSEEASSFSTRIDSIVLAGARISLNNPPAVLQPLAGEYTIDGRIYFNGDSYTLGDATIVLPSKRGTMHPDISLVVKNGDFSITGDVDLEKCSLLWVYTWGENVSLPYHDVSAKVSGLSITSKSVEGSLRGYSTITGNRQLMVNGFCKVNIPAKTVFISNTRGSVQTSSFTIDEFLFLFDGSIKKFRISNIKTQLNDVMPILSFLPSDLFGETAGNLSFDNGKYNGALTLNVGYKRKENLIRNLKGAAVIRDNIIDSTPFTVLIYNQPCTINLATTDGGFKTITANIYCKDFSYDTVADTAAKNSAADSFVPHALPFQANGKIEIDSLRINTFNASKAITNYQFAGSKLTLTNASCQFLGGDIRGKGAIDFSSPAPHAEIAMQFNAIKIQNFSKYSDRIKDRFFGSANGNSELSFTIGSRDDIMNSLRGKLEFVIDKGKLVNTGIQDGLGVWLEDLKYKLKDLEFNKIYGNIGITGNNYQIHSFVFNAPDIRMKINGFFNRDLSGDVRIDLEFTRHFFQDIPNPAVFLQLNKYKRDRWYVIPFQARGMDIVSSKNIVRLH